MRVISPDLQHLESVAVAVLDADGILLETNAGFMRLFGAGPSRYIGANVSDCFSVPRYHELAASRPFPNGDVYQGSMRFRNSKGESIQFRGRVWRSAYGLCVQAEADVGAPGVAVRPAQTDGQKYPEREERIVDPALQDKLTGTGNRERLDQALAAEILRLREGGATLCLLTAGLDHFDKVFATSGDRGGDRMLARFGFLLRLLTRPSDIATRIGKSEFAVLLPHTNLAQAVSAAERIGKALASDPDALLAGSLTASFGLAEFRVTEDAGSFLARAISSLRRAQAAGSNQVVLATADLAIIDPGAGRESDAMAV